MTERETAATGRAQTLIEHISRVDGRGPDPLLSKHAKMAISPYLFFRGSAQLFYADLASQHLKLPNTLSSLPLTCVVGDCHTSNFGFMTEEGSHGDRVIFAANDYDDACVGHAQWDLARYLTSLSLAADHCAGIKAGTYLGSNNGTHKATIDHNFVDAAMDSFLRGYTEICQQVTKNPQVLYSAIDSIPEKTRLNKFYRKAKARAAGGNEFLTKSSLAKAVQMQDDGLAFRRNPDKYARLANHYYESIAEAFAPFMDEDILDIVQRNHSGTGSNNLARYYFLVGPAKPHNENSFARCHIVEVKQQREAAPLYFFDDLSPVNRLNPAHLTARCQRKMQRKPDLLLDEADWQDAHWLIRSRHHARVGIDPQDIGIGNRSVDGGFVDYAYYCGKALALSHARGDRRSVSFEAAVLDTLPKAANELKQAASAYAEQVKRDHAWMVELFTGTPSN